MASSSGSYHMSSSPHSSGSLDSRHDSPETKVTAFSPEESRTPRKDPSATVGTSQEPPAFSLDQNLYQLPSYLKSPKASRTATLKQSGQKIQGENGKDPFLTTDTLKANVHGNHEQKLSPTASAFTPTAGLHPWSGTHTYSSPSSSGSNSSGVGLQHTASVPNPNNGDAALEHFLKSLTINPSHSQAVDHVLSDYGPNLSNTFLPSPPTPDPDKERTVIRALNIHNLSKHTQAQSLNEYFNVSAPQPS